MSKAFDLFPLLIIFTLFPLSAFSQDIPEELLNELDRPVETKYHRHEIDNYQKKYENSLQAEIIKRPYDVLNYDIYLDWFELMQRESVSGEARHWRGRNTITAEIGADATESITFDCAELFIHNVLVDGEKIDPTPQQSAGELTIPLPQTKSDGDTIVCEIEYEYLRNGNIGFYLYKKGIVGFVDYYPPHDTMYVEERIAYLMNEPADARYWMPANDHPHDKAMVTIRVRVPREYSVAANGILEEVIDDGEAQIYYWDVKHPITTYLISATASVFYQYSDWYTRVTNPDEQIEIMYYLWEEDLDGSAEISLKPNAQEAYKNMPEMIGLLSEMFGEYPFEKYGSVSVQPYAMGAMEHQTMTMVNRTVLLGGELTSFHELAHQWLGDYITCATWNDIWINEGGATWSEAIWAEYKYDPSYYSLVMNNKKRYYLRGDALARRPVYGPSINKSVLFDYATTYVKPGWIYHMLSSMLGSEKFLDALQSLMEKYAYRSLDTEQFKESFVEDVENPPVPLDIYLDQWLYKQGHPVYNVAADPDSNYSIGGYDIHLTVSQIQDRKNVPEVFHTPVVFKFFGPDSAIVRDTLINNERVQEATFHIPFSPDSVKIDEDLLLCEVESIILSVRKSENISGISQAKVYPNPARGGEAWAAFRSGGGRIEARIFDQLGAPIMNIYSGIAGPGDIEISFPTAGLSPGAYFIRIREGSQVINTKFTVAR